MVTPIVGHFKVCINSVKALQASSYMCICATTILSLCLYIYREGGFLIALLFATPLLFFAELTHDVLEGEEERGNAVGLDLLNKLVPRKLE